MIKYLIAALCLGAATPLLYAQPAGGNQRSSIRITDSVICTKVKDQAHSPTCWVFGINSLFESDMIKKYDVRLDLSEMFLPAMHI